MLIGGTASLAARHLGVAKDLLGDEDGAIATLTARHRARRRRSARCPSWRARRTELAVIRLRRGEQRRRRSRCSTSRSRTFRELDLESDAARAAQLSGTAPERAGRADRARTPRRSSSSPTSSTPPASPRSSAPRTTAPGPGWSSGPSPAPSPPTAAPSSPASAWATGSSACSRRGAGRRRGAALHDRRRRPPACTSTSAVHQGELIVDGDRIYGPAVNLAARVCALSGPDEILVSASRSTPRSTARDDVRLVDRGEHQFKGIAAASSVYSLVATEERRQVARVASLRVAGVRRRRGSMGSMPNWFAKTKEMAAFDRYFSTRDVDDKGLLDRYLEALERAAGSRLLQPRRRARPRVARRGRTSRHPHADGARRALPRRLDPPPVPRRSRQFGDVGGRFWPQVPSHEVIDELRAGVVFAIHKAMGDTELANLGLAEDYRERLWKAERRQRASTIDDGIRGIALSWNCVAPAGDELLRGRRAARARRWSSSPSPRRARTATARSWAWSTTCAPGSSRSPRRPGNRDHHRSPPRRARGTAAGAQPRRTRRGDRGRGDGGGGAGVRGDRCRRPFRRVERSRPRRRAGRAAGDAGAPAGAGRPATDRVAQARQHGAEQGGGAGGGAHRRGRGAEPLHRRGEPGIVAVRGGDHAGAASALQGNGATTISQLAERNQQVQQALQQAQAALDALKAAK